MASVDQKRAFNKLKHDLEAYRDVILLLNSVLKWDKNFYPGITFGLVSIYFLILWYLDLSLLTLISLFFLCVVIIDYLYPLVSKCIFKADNWTGVQENKFEEVCNEICSTKLQLCSFYNSLFTAKEEKSAVFLISVSVTLILLAWVGSVIDNLFLCYISTLAVTLYPGLHHHGYVKRATKQFGSLLSDKLKQLKDKASKKD